MASGVHVGIGVAFRECDDGIPAGATKVREYSLIEAMFQNTLKFRSRHVVAVQQTSAVRAEAEPQRMAARGMQPERT